MALSCIHNAMLRLYCNTDMFQMSHHGACLARSMGSLLQAAALRSRVHNMMRQRRDRRLASGMSFEGNSGRRVMLSVAGFTARGSRFARQVAREAPVARCGSTLTASTAETLCRSAAYLAILQA